MGENCSGPLATKAQATISNVNANQTKKGIPLWKQLENR